VQRLTYIVVLTAGGGYKGTEGLWCWSWTSSVGTELIALWGGGWRDTNGKESQDGLESEAKHVLSTRASDGCRYPQSDKQKPSHTPTRGPESALIGCTTVAGLCEYASHTKPPLRYRLHLLLVGFEVDV